MENRLLYKNIKNTIRYNKFLDELNLNDTKVDFKLNWKLIKKQLQLMDKKEDRPIMVWFSQITPKTRFSNIHSLILKKISKKTISNDIYVHRCIAETTDQCNKLEADFMKGNKPPSNKLRWTAKNDMCQNKKGFIHACKTKNKKICEKARHIPKFSNNLAWVGIDDLCSNRDDYMLHKCVTSNPKQCFEGELGKNKSLKW